MSFLRDTSKAGEFSFLERPDVRPPPAEPRPRVRQTLAAPVPSLTPHTIFARHPTDSVNAPLYQPIEGWSLQQTMRKATFAFFGSECLLDGEETSQRVRS